MAYSTEKSRQLYERARRAIPGGASSASRTPVEGYKPYPVFIDHAEGARLYDVDGNQYIDYLQALGPTLVGSANPRVTDFVAREIRKGVTYGLPYELQIQTAEKLIDLVPSFERVSFMNSGTEVVQMAIRLARAFTGRSLIAKFEGAYHGWADSVAHSVHPSLGVDQQGKKVREKTPIGSGIPPRAYEDVLVLPWNDFAAVEEAVAGRGEEIAAFLVDPCMCNSGVIPPADGWLEMLREVTARHGIVLIFDEVITGFRLGLQSAQGKFGVVPDLTTMAKAVGGGFPVALYGGKAQIMDLMAEGTVFRAGTVNANRMAVAAAWATLDILSENDGAVYGHIYRVGERLMRGMRDIIASREVRAIVQGYGPLFQIHFTDLERITNYPEFCTASRDLFMSFRNRLLPKGVFLRPAHFGEIYISAAHTDEDIDATLEAMEDAVKEMKKEKLL
ncbi:MAG: aspartate aminotransferase family protein [Spirochaetota bacterium]